MPYVRTARIERWSGPVPAGMEQRFLAKVEKTADCWLWRGRINPPQTGQFRISNERYRGNQSGMRMDAHKLAYLWYVGSIVIGMEIDHTCRVTHCVRPDHLEQITPEKNRERAQNWRLRDRLRDSNNRKRRALAAKARENKKKKGDDNED